MKLTKEMQAYLLKKGYANKEFAQIEQATQEKYTKLECKGKRISHKEARASLGDKEYISGIARSAFHWSAVRVGTKGIILFDSSRLHQE